MSETYRGYVFTEAFVDQVAVYERGTFRGHFPNIIAARAFVDAERTKERP